MGRRWKEFGQNLDAGSEADDRVVVGFRHNTPALDCWARRRLMTLILSRFANIRGVGWSERPLERSTIDLF